MFLSMKGGVAKTTNLTAVAECLATQGNRVLVVDTDHQCGSSAVLLGEEQLDSLERRERTLADLLREALDDDFRPDRIRHYASPASSIADIGDRLAVVPGSLRLEDFWSYYRPTAKRPYETGVKANAFLRTTRAGQFKTWLRANYDYVLVDCPPAVSWQVRFFMLVADGYVVPTIPDRLSVRGARYLTRRIQSLKINIHPVGLLWSMFRKQCGVHCEYVEGIKTGEERLDSEDPNAPVLPQPFTTCIPHGNDVIDRNLNPDSQPKSFPDKYGTEFTKLFRNLTKEILERTRAVTPARPSKMVGSDAGL
jgi:chromosome partitioning protein